MRICDVLMSHVALKLHKPSAVLPLAFDVEKIQPVIVAQRPQLTVYEIRYTLSAQDGAGETILSGTVHLAVLLDDEGAEPAAVLRQVLQVAHDTLRELLHHYTNAMGLPPLVLDLAQIGLDPTNAAT